MKRNMWKSEAWACGRGWWRGRGRRRGGAFILLLTGVGFCLLLPALTPTPRPLEPRRPLRRIHQEEDDYISPKKDAGNPKVAPKIIPTFVSAVNVSGGSLNLAPTTTTTTTTTTKAFSKSGTQPSALGKIRARLESRIDLGHAQQTALNAVKFGYKLTKAQQKILDDMTPEGRKALEERVAKTRMAQDRIYLTHLRSRGQVVNRPGGGEAIVSLANRTVRFPALLKKTPLDQWPPQYKLYYNLTHYPWVRSRGCEGFGTVFHPPASLPQRGLASFPSSGNTWARYLIEGATGIFTGSMYEDTSLMTKGLYGEGLVHDSGMTILQKSHGFTTGDAMTIQDRRQRAQHNHLSELGGRAVVVVRNPFKALISHRHLDVGGHTGYAPKAHFIGQGWAEFVRLKVNLWRDFYEDWVRLTKPPDIHVTHYENLRDDPVGEMRGVLAYLRLVEDRQRLACLGRNLDGLFKRKPRKNLQLNFDPFTEELKGLIYDAIDVVDRALRERGKDGLPLDKYEIYDAKEAETVRVKMKGGGNVTVSVDGGV